VPRISNPLRKSRTPVLPPTVANNNSRREAANPRNHRDSNNSNKISSKPLKAINKSLNNRITTRTNRVTIRTSTRKTSIRSEDSC
jgi:hypothetical protein